MKLAKKTPTSKGIRLNPFDTCSVSNTTSKLQTPERQPQPQWQILRPNWVRITVTLGLHIDTLLSTNLSANLSSLQGNVLAGPQKSKQFCRDGKGTIRAARWLHQASPDRALRGLGFSPAKGSLGATRRRSGRVLRVFYVALRPSFATSPTNPGRFRA